MYFNKRIWQLIVRAYGHLGRGYPREANIRREVTIREYEPECVGSNRVDIIFPNVIVRFTDDTKPVSIPKAAPNIILAIDDEPYRYQMFSRKAARFGWTIIPVDRPAMIEAVLMMYEDRILAVMLDHDMPGKDGKEIAEEFLAPRSIPVIITTNSTPGAKRIAAVLDEYGVPYWIAAAMGMLRDEHWMDILLEIETESGRS